MQNVLAILLAGAPGGRLAPPSPPCHSATRLSHRRFHSLQLHQSQHPPDLHPDPEQSFELTRHIREGWTIFSGELKEFIETIPPMKRIHDDWYLGTADAVYQNIESIVGEKPEYTLILSGDHIYKMDYRELVAWHPHKNADVTIATIQVAPGEAGRFGIVESDSGDIASSDSRKTMSRPPQPAHADHRARERRGSWEHVIGFDLEQDRARGYPLTEGGVAAASRSCREREEAGGDGVGASTVTPAREWVTVR